MTSNSTRLATSEPPQRPRNGPTPPVGDELDDLFNYDVGVDDVFREVDTNMNVPAKPKPRPLKDGNETGAGLGIDEEIKISKKRRPVAKLDEERYDTVDCYSLEYYRGLACADELPES